MSEKVCGIKRPIPYRLAESELCSYEDAPDECVCMGDYMTVFGGYGPDGGELESTGELWGVTYGHDGFIDEVELLDEFGDGHRRSFPCEGVFYKAERPSGAIEFELAYRALDENASLRERIHKLEMEGSDHFYRMAYAEDANRTLEVENTKLQAENAKLREELDQWHSLTAGIELPEYPVTQFKPKDLKRENNKLRELLAELYEEQCDECDRWKYRDSMRELGIEVSE